MWNRVLTVLVVLGSAIESEGGGGGDIQETYDPQLQVGRSIDIFPRYGYLSISMKVVPTNSTDFDTIFREPTVDVFADIERFVERQPRRRKDIFDGDFHMEFCDNLRQLLEAYFREFEIEKLDRPWRAFSGGWTKEAIAKHMGINSSFVHQNDHCYVLIRLSRFRENVTLARLPNNVNLTEMVAQEVDNIKIGDYETVLTFIKKFGSHYIRNYVTGDSLYQVFVFNKREYNKIKRRLKSQDISKISPAELSQYFSPWFAVHTGKIKVASGNRTVDSWVRSKLTYSFSYIFEYPSLLRIYNEPKLLGHLNDLLQNEALIKIDTRTLGPAIKEPAKRRWFQEVLYNTLNLWESNI